MEGWVFYNSRKVYAILEDQHFMYYNDFDKVTGTPKRLQGVIHLRDGKVEKVKPKLNDMDSIFALIIGKDQVCLVHVAMWRIVLGIRHC